MDIASAVSLPNRSTTGSNHTGQLLNPAAGWNFPLISSSCIFGLVILFNTATLSLFCKDWHLRAQPFNTYLVLLMTLNILYALLQNPLDMINHQYRTWWLGTQWCTVLLYAQSIISASVMHCHVLVTISRLWAMTFPMGFQRLHSRKAAAALCVGMLVYVHAILLPDFIAHIYHTKSLEKSGCLIRYRPIIQFLIYVLPETTIIISYPIIFYKRRKRQRVRAQRASAVTYSRADSPDGVAAIGTANEGHKNGAGVKPQKTKGRKRETVEVRSYAFLILTLFTCSVFVCWTPVISFFIVGNFIRLPYPVLFQVLLTLFAIQPVLDPVLLTIAMQDLRSAFMRTCQA